MLLADLPDVLLLDEHPVCGLSICRCCELPGDAETILDPTEQAEAVMIDRHVNAPTPGEFSEKVLLFSHGVTFDPDGERRSEVPLMVNETVAATEPLTGDSELGELDGAFTAGAIGTAPAVLEHATIMEQADIGRHGLGGALAAAGWNVRNGVA